MICTRKDECLAGAAAAMEFVAFLAGAFFGVVGWSVLSWAFRS